MADSIVVLHVDDDPSFAELAADFLEREDGRIAVLSETSAEDGLDRLADGEVDCVVSDYDMPRVDGLEFLERVREREPDVPFVLFTGKGSEEVASEALSGGATDYLQKQSGSDQFEILANRIVTYVENARGEAERRRQLEAIEATSEGIAILDGEGEFRYVNRSYCDLYGYDSDELVGETWGLVHPGGEVTRMREGVVPALFENREWHGETIGQRADGSTFVEDHTITLTPRDEIICTIRDVTDRRERHRELEHYEQIVEAMGDAVYALDADGRVIEANDHVEALTGYDRDDLEGIRPEEFIVDEDIPKFEEAIQELLQADADATRTVEATVVRRDDSTVPIEVSLTCMFEDGEFQGTVGVARDVTDRKERERELEQYETLLELMPDTVIVTDLEGTVTDIHGFEGWSGYTYDELVGSHFSKPLPEADVEHVEEVVADLVLSDDEWAATYETHVTTADGERIPFENNITLLPPDEDGEIPGTMSVLRNIYDRKEHERALERQNERLEEFAGIVSHDLRNPLNVAAGRLQLAMQECDSEHLEAVERSHDRMIGLIDDLLTLARESDPILEREELSLASLARDTWQHVETADATLSVAVDHAVEASESRLKQLFENLFRNAVEHGSTSPRSPSAHGDAVEHGSTSPPSQAREDAVEHGDEDVHVRIGELDEDEGFFVADDGPGIPPEDRDQVFESGYSSTSDGTGFGLAIVQEVAHAHDWEAAVTDAEGGGARFEFVYGETD